MRRKSLSTSHAHVAGRAPSLSSALLPAEARESALPGTAKTSLPCVTASSANRSAPLFSGASTTTVATARPDVMRLRSRKPKRGTDIFGANSLTTAPQRATSCVYAPAKSRLIAVPDTPTQMPPACSAPSAADRSIPAVRPESTIPPCRTISKPNLRAVRTPYGVALRVPTTATAARSSSCGSVPRT